jgi:hypothetical protein
MPNGHDKNWIRLCGALDGVSGAPEEAPTPSAEAWLGVAPDRSPGEGKDRDFHLVFDRLFDEKLLDEKELPWWANLDGEVKQGRPVGRYLEQTLEAAMGPDYRTLPREQFFFTSSKRSCMDGRVGAIGVEEKVIHLDFAGIRDGAICRSMVWVLGNPLR